MNFINILCLSALALISACKNHDVNRKNDSQKITAKNISSLDGMYTMNFSKTENTCQLAHQDVDEDLLYQVDDEKLHPEQLYCKTSLNLELFCGENKDNLIWQGSVNENGQAKLSLSKNLQTEIKNEVFQDFSETVFYSDIVLNISMALQFSKDDQETGAIILSFQMPHELQNSSCTTKQSFVLDKVE